MSDELITLYTFNQNHTRAGQVTHSQHTVNDEVSGDVTEWTGTREELIADHLSRAIRETGRPDFGRTVSRNILEELDVEDDEDLVIGLSCSTCDGTDARLSGSLCPECGS